MLDDLAALRRENDALLAQLAELNREFGGTSAPLLRSVLEALPALITRLDPEGRVVFLNRYAPGYDAGTVLGTSVYDYIAANDIPTARACIERVLGSGQSDSYRVVGDGGNGTTRHYETHVLPITEPDGRRGLCLVSLDITEHVEREQALRRSQESLRLAIEATGMGIWRWDLRTNEVVWNERLLELTGSPCPLTPEEYVEKLAHPDDREELKRAGADLVRFPERAWRMHRLVRPDGAVRWVVPAGRTILDGQGSPLAVIGGMLDVTEQRAIEERLRQTQKLEALGSLTAGVAHNFNNMLAVMLPFLDEAVARKDSHDPALAEGALYAARRAAQMVSQLMTLAGKRPEARRSRRDLRAIARSGARICEPLFGAQIKLTVAEPDEQLLVLCDESAVEQTLVNLLLNARDAVVSGARSEPRIEVQLRAVPTAEVPAFAGRLPRAHAVIEVRDNGAGIAPGTQARLFEPFFTTKAPDRGTGLGLATSYAIVREHAGYISCESAVGVGTTFRIFLPLDGAFSVAEEPDRAPARPGSSLRILVVEDDAMVRRATVGILRNGKHDVTAAANASEALEHATHNGGFDVVLLDRSMPDGAGATIVRSLRSRMPKAKIVYFTGGDVPESEQSEVDVVLYKPFGVRDLLSALERIQAPPATS